MGCGASSKKYEAPADSATADQPIPECDFEVNVSNSGQLEDFYTIGKRLNAGSICLTNEATCVANGERVAVQTIRKVKVKRVQRLNKQLAILKKMNHKHICKLLDSFQDHRNVYLIFELCEGGDVLDRILKMGRLYEIEVVLLMQCLLQAIDHMHAQCVCHMDIKADNLLLTTKGKICQDEDSTVVKLIDFDNASEYGSGKMVQFTDGPPYYMEKNRATNPAGIEMRHDETAQLKGCSQVLQTRKVKVYYVAPEVVWSRRGYNQSADLWSAGVTMFILLSGYPPFPGENDEDVLYRAQYREPDFSGRVFETVSREARKLLENLLDKTAKKRFTAAKALDDDWLKMKMRLSGNPPLDTSIVENLQNFYAHNNLKKVALHYIAQNVDESQIHRLAEAFKRMDTNGDGTLSKHELKEGLNNVKSTQTNPDLQAILAGVSTSSAGKIDYIEFITAALNERRYIREEMIWEAFRRFDKDGSGKLSKDEIIAGVNNHQFHTVDKKEITELLQDIDENGDGTIDFDEFSAMILKGAK